MSIIRASITLNDIGGLPENGAVNVWHFQDAAASLGSASAVAIGALLPAFYQDPTVAKFWGHTIGRSTMTHKCSIAQVSPNAAPGVGDDTIGKVYAEYMFSIATIPPSSSYPFPAEVACALSFQGDITGIPEEVNGEFPSSIPTRPASRRRGRVFLGPLNDDPNQYQPGDKRSFPGPEFRNAVMDAYQSMIASLQSLPAPITHVVYSPTSATAFPVVECSMDDAWDTIRSRGQVALERLRRAVVQA